MWPDARLLVKHSNSYLIDIEYWASRSTKGTLSCVQSYGSGLISTLKKKTRGLPYLWCYHTLLVNNSLSKHQNSQNCCNYFIFKRGPVKKKKETWEETEWTFRQLHSKLTNQTFYWQVSLGATVQRAPLDVHLHSCQGQSGVRFCTPRKAFSASLCFLFGWEKHHPVPHKSATTQQPY